jgi:hypothetical protein
MQKPYSLLRSNQEMGPYSLDELLQLGLKPFDLIWVNGRSAAWQYPSEIESLKAFFPVSGKDVQQAEAPESNNAYEDRFQQPVPAPPKKIFVSMPSPANGSRIAENKTAPQAIPERTEPRQEVTAASVNEYAAKTNYSKSLTEVEEEYTNWVYKQKTKKKVTFDTKKMFRAAMLLVLLGGGYFLFARLFTKSGPAPIIALDKTSVATIPENDAPASAEATEETIPVTKTKQAVKKHDQAAAKAKEPKTTKAIVAPKTVETVRPPLIIDNEKNAGQEIKEDKASTAETKKDTQKEKKKGLGTVFKNVLDKFKSKKKEEDKTEVPVTVPEPRTDRTSAHRDDAATNAVDPEMIAQQLIITSNSGDNWMMGVKGLKLTLNNRSNATIKSAPVIISYYNQSDDLLEKKTIVFSNVPPKGKVSLPAPDNKWADHVEYKLGTIAVKEDGYVSN